jgi:hypothetical protein
LKSLFFVASKTKNFLVSSNHLPVLLVACPLFACPRDDFSIPHHNINECFKMKTHRNPEKSQENLFFFVYKIKDRVWFSCVAVIGWAIVPRLLEDHRRLAQLSSIEKI